MGMEMGMGRTLYIYRATDIPVFMYNDVQMPLAAEKKDVIGLLKQLYRQAESRILLMQGF